MKRIMIAAASSGSGKTTMVCGLLELFKRHNISVAAFKCGPDFIDPLFHKSVIGTDCGNLDTFFTEDPVTRELLVREAKGKQLALIEGVMGYYDGIGFEKNARGSSAYLAAVTKTPVILVVNAKGMSRSAVALIRGFLEEQQPCMIRGIILNRISPMIYPQMKQMIEEALPVRVVGYLPEQDCFPLQSRHLGLVKPDEIPEFQDELKQLADLMEKTIDLNVLLELSSEKWPYTETDNDRDTSNYNEAAASVKYKPEAESVTTIENKTELEPVVTIGSCPDHDPASVPETRQNAGSVSHPIRIGIARDEAFCFIYRENLDLLQESGCELCFFSPLRDRELPDGLDGLILSGGYPELYASDLSGNVRMRQEIADVLRSGLPTIAECGGFLYLHKSLTDLDGKTWPMTGYFDFSARYSGKLGHFGYINLKEGKLFGSKLDNIRAHEFHYYESEDPGDDFLAVKPSGKRSWRCIHSSETLYAGFPHLYYPANPGIVKSFLKACRRFR